jgi:hypothetical protein
MYYCLASSDFDELSVSIILSNSHIRKRNESITIISSETGRGSRLIKVGFSFRCSEIPIATNIAVETDHPEYSLQFGLEAHFPLSSTNPSPIQLSDELVLQFDHIPLS